MPRDPLTPSDEAFAAAFAAEGARLAADGEAIASELRDVLADALAAVLADAEELARLAPESARDAVEYLLRLGRLESDEAEAIVLRAGKREQR